MAPRAGRRGAGASAKAAEPPPELDDDEDDEEAHGGALRMDAVVKAAPLLENDFSC